MAQSTKRRSGRPPLQRQKIAYPVLSIPLAELIERKSIAEGRTISAREIADITGIPREKLRSVLDGNSDRFYLRDLGRLLAYFECSLEELVNIQTNDRPGCHP